MAEYLLHWRPNGARHSAANVDRADELCQRPDAHYLIFFSVPLLRHLGHKRQDVLHTFLQRLEPRAPGASEWYHHDDFAKCLHALPAIAPTRLWHRETQQLLLERALTSTEMSVLATLPALEYVDTAAAATAILEAHPRDQTARPADESRPPRTSSANSSWSVVDGGDDIADEIERRFAALPPPLLHDAVGAREVDELLLNVGRADHTDNALRVIARYPRAIKIR